MSATMKVNNSTKRYWARTGPNAVFGSDWSDREDFSDTEAEERFDQIWASHLYPAIQSGQKVSANHAKVKVPKDGRQKYFDARQEHREVQLGGTTLLAQIDVNSSELTQMWHLNDKGGARVRSNPSTASSGLTPAPAPSAPIGRGADRLTQLANRTGLPKAELAAAFAGVLADMFLASTGDTDV